MWTSRLSDTALRTLVLACFGGALFVAARALATIPPAPAPRYGLRGKRRSAARANELFRVLEPCFAQLAGWLARGSFSSLRARLTLELRYASEPAGLSADELLACALLSLFVVGGAGSWLAVDAELSAEVVFGLWLVAGVLPLGRVRAAAKQRAKQLERSLPNAMDLCVLCMGAGADFPGALRFVVHELGAAHAVCREELSFVRDELALGRTRSEALRELAERSGSMAVREFVAAICQSEEKGTPLIEALSIQSSTLRQRRSVRAEELAAQAGIKMMLPLMLLVSSLLLIVFGPIITSGTGL